MHPLLWYKQLSAGKEGREQIVGELYGLRPELAKAFPIGFFPFLAPSPANSKGILPVLNSHPLKDLCALTSYAVVPTLPETIALDDHPLRLSGKDPGPRVWSGIYGTTSSNEAQFHHYAVAAAAGMQCYQVQTFVQLRDFAENKGRMTLEQVFHTGFLNVDRIPAALQRQLRDLLLARLKVDLGPAQSVLLGNLKLLDLMEQHPITAKFLLDAFERVNLVVHPVRLVGAGTERFWAGTIRRENRPRYKSDVRYLEGQHNIE
jgi:hypothetical protein